MLPRLEAPPRQDLGRGPCPHLVFDPLLIVHHQLETKSHRSLVGMREKGEECVVPCSRLLGGARLFKIHLGLLNLVMVLVDGSLEYSQVGFARLPR